MLISISIAAICYILGIIMFVVATARLFKAWSRKKSFNDVIVTADICRLLIGFGIIALPFFLKQLRDFI